LRWSEIDLEARTITLPRERTKNGQKHVVPLSDAAMAVICSIDRIEGRDHLFGKGPSGYNGWSKGKKAFDKLARLGEPWCFHDLRRTCRSGLGKLGVAPHVAEAVINHMPEKLIRTYDTNKYENEKRAALDAWAGQIRLIVAQATGGNVVTLRKA
jgi:integrase